MNATYGLRSTTSSASAALEQLLASRLQDRLASRGGTMWQQTWKVQTTPLRRRISAHTQSGLRTSDSACIGWHTPLASDGGGKRGSSAGFGLRNDAKLASWPTPAAHEPGGTPEQHLDRKRAAVERGVQMGSSAVTHLSLVAQMTGWPTPQARDGANGRSGMPERTGGQRRNLDDYVTLSSWPTPTSADHKRGAETNEAREARGAKTGTTLIDAASWATPTACTPNSLRGRGQDPMKRKAQGHAVNLQDQVTMASAWSTPSARDWKDIGPIKPRADGTERLDQLPRQAHLIGETSSGSPAPTAKPGQLNPRFSGWMMGYPVSWDIVAMAIDSSSRRSSKSRKTASPDCADTATPSCPPSPPSS
jgi:hypothetical protein